MHNQKISATIIAFSILLWGLGASAQTNNPFGNRDSADTSISYKPPAIYVTKINLDPIDSQNNVSGKFTVWNNEKDLIGGLLYRIDLLDPLPKANPDTGNVEDNSLLYDRFVSTEQFSLNPNEKKDFSFSYSAPPLPAGNYRIQITATNSLGRDMGWWDADLRLNEKNQSFIKLVSGPLLSPEYPDRRFPSQAGPNISPNNKFTLNVTALNAGNQDLQVIPTMYLYEFDVARGLLDTIRGKEETIRSRATKDIVFPVSASDVPRVYYALLVLEDVKNGNRVSNLNEYRWVVKGEHAEVLSMRVIKPANKSGEEMMVRIDLVGAADATTKTKVNLSVAIKDKDGVVGDINVNSTELTDGVATTEGPIILKRDMREGGKLVASLKNTSGNEISSYSIPLDFSRQNSVSVTPDSSTKSIIPVAVIIIIICIVICIAIIFFLKQKRS